MLPTGFPADVQNLQVPANTGTCVAWRVFGTLQQYAQVIYVQQFVPNAGFDVRVLLLGEKAWSIKRHASPGNWRSNLSQGSRAERHVATPEELRLATAARDAVGGVFVGVDIIRQESSGAGQEDLRVIEVNAVPGWLGLGKCLKVDIAQELLSYLSGS